MTDDNDDDDNDDDDNVADDHISSTYLYGLNQLTNIYTDRQLKC